MITPADAELRLEACSRLRALVLELRRAAAAAHAAGRIPWAPAPDFRSDPEYWRRKALERGIELPD